MGTDLKIEEKINGRLDLLASKGFDSAAEFVHAGI
jgi:hypothetical protein